VNLEIPLKSGDAIGFRLTLGEDCKSVRVTPEIVGKGGNYDEIISLKYESKFEIIERVSRIALEDVLIIKYRDQDGEHLTIRGINEKVPRRVFDAPEHFIAMYYEKMHFEGMGGKIVDIEPEYPDEGVRFDYLDELGEQIVFTEVKHGYEEGSLDDLIKQANKYLNFVRDKVTRGMNAILMYRFYDEPQSPNAKAFFKHLKELYKSNRDVLKIFIKGVEWTGG